MKSTLILASLAILGSFSVLNSNNAVADASPLGLEKRQQPQAIWDKWCESYEKNCVAASGELCGSTTHFSSCKAAFNNDQCTSYEVYCYCTLDGKNSKSATAIALEKTFSNMNGACSTLPKDTIRIPLNSTSSLTTATATTTAPSATSTTTPAPGTEKPKNAATKSSMSVLSTVAVTAAISLGLLCF